MITQNQLTPRQRESQKEKLAKALELLTDAMTAFDNSADIDIIDIAHQITTAELATSEVATFFKTRQCWMV